MRFAWLVLLVACNFNPGFTNGTGDAATMSDGRKDGSAGGNADAMQLCLGSTPFELCLATPPAMPIMLTSNIDTGQSGDVTCASGSTMGRIVAINSTAVCLFVGTTLQLPSSASLNVRGARPLVLAATDRIIIDGTLNLSGNKDQQSAACVTAGMQGGGPDSAGGGGGAGGGFGSPGGNGGSGNAGSGGAGGVATAPAAAPINTLRGGCRGGDGGVGAGSAGKGGEPGGVVYLVAANQIVVTGTINASGSGGTGASLNDGGGGGGSGGMIVFSSMIVSGGSSTKIFANGGGGGGAGTAGGNGGGGPGGKPSIPSMAAGGGSNHTPGTVGGEGAFLGTSAVSASTASGYGGGGAGGGGVGVIRVLAPTAMSFLTDTVSPLPSS